MMWFLVLGILSAFFVGYGWALWVGNREFYRRGYEKGRDDMIARLLV